MEMFLELVQHVFEYPTLLFAADVHAGEKVEFRALLTADDVERMKQKAGFRRGHSAHGDGEFQVAGHQAFGVLTQAQQVADVKGCRDDGGRRDGDL